MKTQAAHIILCLLMISFFAKPGAGQETLDNTTRSNFILDISKYVNWENEEFAGLEDFTIGVLADEIAFFLEFHNVVKSRDTLHNKGVKLVHFRKIEDIVPTQVLFVYQKDNFNINNILKNIKGNRTLLITENYEFQKSMINFLVVEKKPRFEANQERMEAENLKVSELFLAQSIKTREDWEGLYEETDIALEEEKVITTLQKIFIKEQKEEIEELAQKIEIQKKKLGGLNKEITIKQKDFEQKSYLLVIKSKELVIKNKEIEVKNEELFAKEKVLHEKEKVITIRNKEIKLQGERIASQKSIMSEQLKAIEKQEIVIFFFVIVLCMIIGLGYFIYRAYKIKKEANIVLEAKNKKILEQKEEIEKERDVIRSQRDQIAYQKQHIMDSIEYAKRIQTAMIPSIEFFSDRIEHFVLFKPRDIVSGDFYWNCVVDNKLIVVAADCTGHGVPGAFMSMLGVSLLNEIVINKQIYKPNEILNQLRKSVISSLGQSKEDSAVKDGMDIAICVIDKKKDKLQFAGAFNPMYFFRKNELTEVKGDKMPASIYMKMNDFTIHEFDLQKGDTFYIFSDGYVDQFGGPKYKKFMSKNFKEILKGMQNKSMVKQAEKLDTVFEEWKKDVEQIDDVCVIGIRY